MQTPILPVRPAKTAWRRDCLRVRLTSARSIEETGLDSCPYGEYLSPQSAASHPEVTWSKDSNWDSKTENVNQRKCYHLSTREAEQNPENLEGKSGNHELTSKESFSENGPVTLEDGHVKFDKKRQRKVHRRGGQPEFMARNETARDIGKEEETAHIFDSKAANGDSNKDHGPSSEKGGESEQAEIDIRKDTLDEPVFLERCNATFEVGNDDDVSGIPRPQSANCILGESSGVFSSSEATVTSACLQDIVKENGLPSSTQSLDDSLSEISIAGNHSGGLSGAVSSPGDTTNSAFPFPTAAREDSFDTKINPLLSAKQDARSRWRRLKHTVALVNHMTANMRSSSHDLLEDSSLNEILQNQSSFTDDAGGVGAAAFEGAKTMARFRPLGRKGMEGLLVRQDKCFIIFIQDFYVSCLKMPIGHFLIGVFLAPLALGLLFTPLYLMDVDGLTFNGVAPSDAEMCSPVLSAKQRCLAILNVFLYALSLSTTFGGSPVAAVSPFCLLVANVNTLLSQFLFVFLSGAVFARMSQPSHPIRCSKKAVIKSDDISPVLGPENKDKFKVFAVRLVLTGPSPCELVDAKICLTFRLFIKLPSGSLFCSTQDLELVRPEVSYLRYGLMVRHIIDMKSPVYGHTMESLREGDASFSLTVMGSERTSMQPIFHLEDYFVCDGDVIWDGDYVDFIHINEKGQRVLDHSKLDMLKPMKAAAVAGQAIARMKNLAQQRAKEGRKADRSEIFEKEFSNQPGESSSLKNWWMNGLQKRTLWKSKSSSFTRAHW